ncbi:MAG: ribonuclease III [Candidatus Melainabacteria bacterium]|nr:ribonuclease III [Candidatus Melainabacteria bacterium]
MIRKLVELSENRKKDLVSFSKSLGLTVRNLQLLDTALTHTSYVKEVSTKSLIDNERLEFFGDAVLKLVVSEYLMSKYSVYSEGQLSKLRAFVVSEKVLAEVAVKLDLKRYLLLGKNEKKSLPVSILADSMEAVLAVIYYECGADKTRDFIISYWKEHVEYADKNNEKDNFKAVLQEYLQGNSFDLPVYRTLSEAGPDHNKRFEVGVFLNNNELARGVGKTKKDASQEAARNALMVLKYRTGSIKIK